MKKKNPDTTEMENLLNEDYKETMQGRTEEINTKASEFKIITDQKDEPNLKEAQKFVGGYVEDCTVCTYNTMRDKAWSILQTMPHTDDDVAFILRGPKITDFFYCIMGENVCVIDGHAWCIANNDRRTMQEVPGIGKKLRQELQTSYSRAGKKHNMLITKSAKRFKKCKNHQTDKHEAGRLQCCFHHFQSFTQ